MPKPTHIISKLPADEQARLNQDYQEKEELQQRFDTLRLIINTAGVGIIAVDQHHRIIDTNHTLARMFGYSIEELKGKDASILLPTNIYVRHQQLIRELSKQRPSVLVGNTRQHPLYGVHKTNGRFPVEIAISNILIKGQTIFTGIVRDRTLADKLERNLENQTKALKNRVRELEAFQELSKLGSEDDIDGIISRFIVDVVPKSTEYPDKTVTIIELEDRVYRNTSREPVVKLTSPLLDGRLTFGFTEEIPFHSESKQNLLNAYAAELGEIIKRRKAENSMMQSERKTAMRELSWTSARDVEKKSQNHPAINTFASNRTVSRDVSERLHKIASKTKNPGNSRQSWQEENSSSMSNSSVFDLGDAVLERLASTKNSLISDALRRGVSISFNTTCGADILVKGVPAEITIIVQELIKNGADACIEDGVIDIDIRVHEEQVRLRVSDTGKGMDEKTQKRIFDPYFTTKDHELGFGLSLSTAQNIAKEYGGEISVVDSRPGCGTTMELRLPSAKLQQEHHKKPGEMKILWAEDDDILKAIAQKMTQNLNHDITFVDDGQHALEMLNSKNYDLLITDMSMPRMSGWQLLKRIQGRYSSMQRAIASGYLVNHQDMERHGAQYFLSKPLDQGNLMTVLDKAAHH